MKKINTYLVSLEKDTQRRTTLKQLFPVFFEHFIHIPAVDGRALSAEDYFHKINPHLKITGRMISPSELGCTLSHIQVLKALIESDAEYGLILEDDIIGNDQQLELIHGIAQQLDENSVLICGGQQGIRSIKYVYGQQTTISDVWKLAEFSKYQISRTCCYLLHRKAAQKILDCHAEHLRLADDWGYICSQQALNVLFTDILEHPLVQTPNCTSHIEAERHALPKFKRQPKGFLGRLLGTNRKNLKYLMIFTANKPFSHMKKKSNA